MKSLHVPVALALVSTLVAFVLKSPLAPLEDRWTSWKYDLRGARSADTNIVIVYLDADALRELGWPVRRNFYALMVKALTDLQARVIGIDVLFENPSAEYPEYDRLLHHVVHQSRRVVLNCYFNTVSGESVAPADSLLEAFDFPHISDVEFRGQELHVPMQPLLNAAAGTGHANLVDGTRVPLFIAGGPNVVPAFGLEMLRVFRGLDRSALRYEDGELSFKHNGKAFRIDSEQGLVRLYFPGKITAFRAYPFLEVLRSYDALRSGATPAIDVKSFRDKIILVGLITEERTFTTPVDERLPALAIHAVFLDNALHSGFLSSAPEGIVYLLCALAGLVCAWMILSLTDARRFILPGIVLVGAAAGSVALFAAAATDFPFLPFLITVVTASTGAFLLRHRFLTRQLKTVQSEKERIESELRDREAKVAALERELVSLEARRQTERTQELMEEIRRYRSEIHALSSQKDDLEEAVVADTEVLEGPQEFEGIIYDPGGAMKQVIDFVAKIADSDATVLLLGESGTGKEMVARAIHRRSKRKDRPFVAVNCGALAESLLESELFGHEKGAFTGAVKEKQGRFELADGGTIFLDEIAEVSEAFQVKLLRVLQEGEFERVGGTRTLNVDVRVIAATNKDLKQLVQQKRFREDLYYRLNVLTVELPPLRERAGDIPLLVQHFLKKERAEMKLSRMVLEAMRSYGWPGNVRELESVIKRAVLLAGAEGRNMITARDLPEELVSTARGVVALDDHILELLREKKFSRNAISETAQELGGLNRGTVAEHFRGYCLKAFVDHTYELDTTVRYISLSADEAVNERVKKKLIEYLSNIAEAVDRSQPWERVKPSLKSKTKNLPQKYHPFVEQVAESYYRNVWKLEENVR